MAKIINVREIYRKLNERLSDREKEELKPFLKQGQNIEQLLIGAILDPDEKTRERLVKTLNQILGNSVQRGFAADNQLFLTLESDDPRISDLIAGTYCICDMPKTYLGSPSKPHRFYRKK